MELGSAKGDRIMDTVDLFYQCEGIREIQHVEVDCDATFATVKDKLIDKHGLGADACLFLEDKDDPVSENEKVIDCVTGTVIKVHLNRCRVVEICVSFNGRTVEHGFGPSATIARVKCWAAEGEFGMEPTDASEYALQIVGTHERPTPGTHIGTLVHCLACSLGFDLAPDERVNGSTRSMV